MQGRRTDCPSAIVPCGSGFEDPASPKRALDVLVAASRHKDSMGGITLSIASVFDLFVALPVLVFPLLLLGLAGSERCGRNRREPVRENGPRRRREPREAGRI